ncbi:MAG: DUF885 domain-containing protein [Chitinophaga sp.]|jgi:uncharacterized protein (DUF885 family)|nr:DUF885 domain-containing protein [Chitinophaga sp.]
MKKIILLAACSACFIACKQKPVSTEANKPLATLFDKYYEERLQIFPLEATSIGDSRYNDKLYVDFTDSYRAKEKIFFQKYLDSLVKYNRDELNDDDKVSYDDFKREMEINIEGLSFHDNYMPLNQFSSIHLTFAQLGSGGVIQPFKTVKDYDDWLQRAAVFADIADSAIVYFKKGLENNIVLSKALVVKTIPQLQSLVVADAKKSLFYGPITNLPKDFSEADKKRFTEAYTKLINEKITPSYKKLADFLQTEYLPKSRATSGIGNLPDGKKMYEYLVRSSTTTNKTSDEIYNIGLSEVKRIRGLMDSIKNVVGFKDSLSAFFKYMDTAKRFMPYKTPKEVLDAFESIHKKMEPQLKVLFNHVPKCPFEIRQTEAFRAASASAEYFQGSPDGKRPGIFYVPILDATKFNTTSGMESLFLHEAIPGHHYQISLQQEDTALPKFRRFGGQNAFVEGWALYCESLGKELGLYTDPYQYMGALGDEMHRAVRLVVDVGLHAKGMTREEAIKYMEDNEPITDQLATSEIERYMAIPSQALGYKIGALKLRELRNKYSNQLGSKFSIAAFHDEVLTGGSLPLEILEKKLDSWADKQK